MTFASNLRIDSVGQAQGKAPLCFSPEASVRKVLAALAEHRCGVAVICEDRRPLGIFTERDALRLMARRGPLDVPVRQAMIAPVVTVPHDASLHDAIRLMTEGGYRRLPIVDVDGRLEGIVKVSGIVHYFVDHFPETILNLPEPNVVMPEREGA